MTAYGLSAVCGPAYKRLPALTYPSGFSRCRLQHLFLSRLLAQHFSSGTSVVCYHRAIRGNLRFAVTASKHLLANAPFQFASRTPTRTTPNGPTVMRPLSQAQRNACDAGDATKPGGREKKSEIERERERKKNEAPKEGLTTAAREYAIGAYSVLVTGRKKRSKTPQRNNGKNWLLAPRASSAMHALRRRPPSSFRF
ncbi:hypothetical protein HPB50_006931 [Hyalomma asiaticum]|uniref:Uncharacterized protein n=1 Tax=Hyalomma asiaticum TaxID=266040 RepID=A0ACB7T8C3_HYAAI|nr:hypothetical protein HPB50_006931 [Hyalomma asiaticum]